METKVFKDALRDLRAGRYGRDFIDIKDDFHNSGRIEYSKRHPYNGAHHRTDYYRIYLNNNTMFTYHVSCYDNINDTIQALNNLSCGTWHIIE